ncbi:MAG: GTP-binding protein [archaeon]|nr:GTP-binding protein [archaeon]
MDDAESCKVVLLGESGVGKTSIITQFTEEMFSEEQQSTTGATFSSKEISCLHGKRNLKFEIWDTAGQEKYRALSKMFYKDAAAAVLVYDITRKSSFEEVKNYWANEIKEYSPKKIVLAIAANKSDLFEQEEVNEQTGRDLATELGAIFFTTSAKNQNGINELFEAIGNKYCDPSWDAGKDAEEEAEEIKNAKKGNLKLGPPDKKNEDKEKKKGCC